MDKDAATMKGIIGAAIWGLVGYGLFARKLREWRAALWKRKRKRKIDSN
jgi:uncharacterized protein (DUF2062 family)